MIASLLAFAARPLPPPSTAPRGLHPHRRSLDAATALRCRAAGLLAAALQGSGPRERALIDAAARSLADLGAAHVLVASESARARQVAQRLHDAVTALPEADRVPVLVAIVRTLLEDAPDAMVTLDRAMRDAATWREVGITAEHERAAAELVREVGL